MTHTVVQADCLEFLKAQPEDSLDLVFGSPPYQNARLYLEDGQDLGVARAAEEWAWWMVDVFKAAQKACKGLVAMVVAGQTNDFRWNAAPAILMTELHRQGFNLRNPPIYHRVGIPGSGGPDWLRSDYEWVVCTSRPGRLPWSDPTACGHPPKYAPGGEMSHQTANGRVNKRDKWGRHGSTGNRKANGERKPQQCNKRATRGYAGGDTVSGEGYEPPVLANPGNVIHCPVGGGQMGSPLAHDNEAPFPERLAEFFVLSFCPPGGLVCDPFSGSGTTAAVCKRWGRRFTGCDLRASQVELTRKRLETVTPSMFV